MKPALHFAWLTALAGVVFANRRRKTSVTQDHHGVWFGRPGGHQVADDMSSRVPVQAEPRLGRLHVRRRGMPPEPRD